MKRRVAPVGFTLVEIMVVIVIIGLLASLAIPGFQKVRANSQDRAVFNNARQLAAAANQYMTETGATTVDLDTLVGSTNYVKTLSVMASEIYPSFYTQAVTITILGVGGARTITYDF